MSEAPPPPDPVSWGAIKAVGPGGLGIILAALAMLLSFFTTGAGHGWGGSFVVSMPLLLVYPVVLVRARAGGGKGGVAVDIALVLFAIAADAWLINSALTFGEARGTGPNETIPGIHRSVFPILLVWLVLWLHWQLVALRTLWRVATRRR